MKDDELVKAEKEYGPDFHAHLLEQYKLMVETSLDVTSKRLESNKFHLTLTAIIFGFAGSLIIINQPAVIILLSIIGIVVSVVWRKSILAYKELNKAKFKVIHSLEAYLPACMFKCEEEHSALAKYHGLTSAEKWYPIIFIVLYVSIIVLTIYAYFASINFLSPNFLKFLFRSLFP